MFLNEHVFDDDVLVGCGVCTYVLLGNIRFFALYVWSDQNSLILESV